MTTTPGRSPTSEAKCANPLCEKGWILRHDFPLAAPYRCPDCNGTGRLPAYPINVPAGESTVDITTGKVTPSARSDQGGENQELIEKVRAMQQGELDILSAESARVLDDVIDSLRARSSVSAGGEADLQQRLSDVVQEVRQGCNEIEWFATCKKDLSELVDQSRTETWADVLLADIASMRALVERAALSRSSGVGKASAQSDITQIAERINADARRKHERDHLAAPGTPPIVGKDARLDAARLGQLRDFVERLKAADIASEQMSADLLSLINAAQSRQDAGEEK